MAASASSNQATALGASGGPAIGARAAHGWRRMAATVLQAQAPAARASRSAGGAGGDRAEGRVDHQREQLVLGLDVAVERHGGRRRARRATRLIETAARPSASAIAIAAATIRSRLSPGLGPLAGAAAPAAPRPGGRCRALSPLLCRGLLRIPYAVMRTPYAEESIDAETWPMNAVEAIGLEKSYGDVRVLDGVDLRVRAGQRVRAAGPERGGQDHDGADPLHARRAPTAAGRGSPASTWSPSGARCAAASA